MRVLRGDRVRPVCLLVTGFVLVALFAPGAAALGGLEPTPLGGDPCDGTVTVVMGLYVVDTPTGSFLYAEANGLAGLQRGGTDPTGTMSDPCDGGHDPDVLLFAGVLPGVGTDCGTSEPGSPCGANVHGGSVPIACEISVTEEGVHKRCDNPVGPVACEISVTEEGVHKRCDTPAGPIE